jgi:hypothetical protein
MNADGGVSVAAYGERKLTLTGPLTRGGWVFAVEAGQR